MKSNNEAKEEQKLSNSSQTEIHSTTQAKNASSKREQKLTNDTSQMEMHNNQAKNDSNSEEEQNYSQVRKYDRNYLLRLQYHNSKQLQLPEGLSLVPQLDPNVLTFLEMVRQKREVELETQMVHLSAIAISFKHKIQEHFEPFDMRQLKHAIESLLLVLSPSVVDFKSEGRKKQIGDFSGVLLATSMDHKTKADELTKSIGDLTRNFISFKKRFQDLSGVSAESMQTLLCVFSELKAAAEDMDIWRSKFTKKDDVLFEKVFK